MLCCVSCLWFMSSFRHCAESGISGVPGPGIGDRKLRQFSPPDGVTESTVVFRVTFFGLEMGIGFGTGIEAEKGHSRASREPSWGPQTAKQTPGPELCRRNLKSLCGSAIFGQILGGSPSGPPQNAQKKHHNVAFCVFLGRFRGSKIHYNVAFCVSLGRFRGSKIHHNVAFCVFFGRFRGSKIHHNVAFCVVWGLPGAHFFHHNLAFCPFWGREPSRGPQTAKTNRGPNCVAAT